MPSLWTRLRAAVDPVAQRLGRYTAYALKHDEYVGCLGPGFTLADARTYLRQNAYEPQYLSAAKALPGSTRPFAIDELHDLSYRHVPDAHPPEWTADRFDADGLQYHVHVFDSDDSGPLFFSHLETRPFAHPVEHYRPGPDTYLKGVTDLDLND